MLPYSSSIFILFSVVLSKPCSAQRSGWGLLDLLQTVPQIPRFYSSDFHKFDINVNHIISGYIYLSPSQKKARVDAAGDGFLEASFFDFNNSTADGTVANVILSFEGGVTQPAYMHIFFNPSSKPSQKTSWFCKTQSLQEGGSLQVTFFLDTNNTLVRFDFAASDTLRSFATTRFFNIVQGTINSTVFENSCQ
ncbi:hypothetical protein B0H34DRAFT_678339 [Crassisporium funariophilum]|nr:hypothetical protein B0H34DRAFT_678339 [Crassisporium funariophilum]